MAENRIKKKRIAHIGNMTSAQGTTNLHCDEGLEQADCNLVYNIMQSMDKSQNAVTYQQLTEFRSKEKIISRTNNAEKRNSKSLGSKQIKKFVPEKTFPLMAKCQKSMKYLKKNRCIPKPRAHVGSVLKLTQISSINCNSSHIYNNCNASSSSTVNHEKGLRKRKQYSKKESSSEMNVEQKKPKISLSLDSSRDNAFEKEPMLIGETDTDSEFEQFLQKHHPEKGASSYISDSSITRRKSNKVKRKKRNKKLACATKITKVTSRKLSDFEESNESEVECNENNHKNITVESTSTENSYSRQFPSRRFQRIIEHQTSDDNASDAHLNDSGILIHDSLNSSQDENMIIKSSNKTNMSIAPDVNGFESLEILSVEPNSVTLSTLSEPKNNLNCEILKSKCFTPCYVLLKRDPLLDQKAASIHTYSSSVTNSVVVSNLYDDGDCIIISELSTIDNNSQESESIRQSIENRNRCRGNSTVNSESPVSEALPEIDSTQNKYMLTKKQMYSSSNISPQTDPNPLISNQRLAKNLCDDKSMEVQRDEKEVFRSVVASIKSQSDIEKDENFILNEVSKHSDKNINSAEYEEKSSSLVSSVSQHISELPKDETGVSIKNDRSISSVEKEMFNVQILSVKSLNESDIIILSDDDEGKDSEPISTINVTKESAAEDSDVEIICLDSSIDNKKKSVNENIKDVLNHKMHNKVRNGLKGNSSNSSANPVILDEEDCIILDDVDLQSEKHSVKNADTVYQSSQVNVMSDSMINSEKMNSNKNRETTSGKELDSGNSILKILDTIDFNCIKKVLNETATVDIKKVKNSDSTSIKTENSLYEDIQTSEKEKTADSFSEKLKQSQNDIRPQKQTMIDVNITPVGSSELNIRSLKISLVNKHEEHFELPQNSGVSHKIIKSDSENLRGPKSNETSSSGDSEKSSTFMSSSTILAAPKLSICDKEIIASNHKTEQDALLHSRKNQQLLPAYPKMERYESSSDELDIIAAKSIQNLDEHEKQTILPLLELYRAEYKKFMEIKCTEKNVTAGLKLLEDKQTKKLMVISSSIKNLVKNDGCFHKVNNEFGSNQNEHKSFIKSNAVKKDESSDEIKNPLEYKTQPANNNCFEIERDDKVKIFHPSVVETASEVLKSKSVGPSSSQEVYNHLINSVCAECGKNAVAACYGCAKIFYCSEKCGLSFWNKGHYATCRR